MTVSRLVKGFLCLRFTTGLQREELNCLGQGTVAWCLKQNRLDPILGSTLLCRLSLKAASYHLFASVVGQEILDRDPVFLQFESDYLTLPDAVALG